MVQTFLTPFHRKLGTPLAKEKITVLQINLGKRCNLACTHCHVEAGPKRTEELSEEVCAQLVRVIEGFPQIETVDLTGGAPEMNYGFRALVEAARGAGKEVIVRSNLTIFFVDGYEDLPEYFAQIQRWATYSYNLSASLNRSSTKGERSFSKSSKTTKRFSKVSG